MDRKIGINLIRKYSINFNPLKRPKKSIQFIIIHYTGMKKEIHAIKRLCNFKSQVSSHYFIKSNGEVLSIVPDLYEAWHAGKSSWRKYNSLNKNSIGIEINNPGHKNGYKNFSIKQITSLEKLLKFLTKKYRIKPINILGHSDIAPSRKIDPGEKFPWYRLSKKNLCHWHSLDQKELIQKRNIMINSSEKMEFLKNLYRLGYCKIRGIKNSQNSKLLTLAFQRRFRQNKVNGIIDKECLFISQNL